MKTRDIIESPRKSSSRPQIAFNLSADEEELKRDFAKLVGSRGTKPVLIDFMRSYVRHGGRVAITSPDEPEDAVTEIDGTLRPHTEHESRLVHALLEFLRSDAPEDFKRIPECVLGPWLKRPKKSKTRKSERKFA